MLKFQIVLIAILVCCFAFISCDRTQPIMTPVMDSDSEKTGYDMTGMEGEDADKTGMTGMEDEDADKTGMTGMEGEDADKTGMTGMEGEDADKTGMAGMEGEGAGAGGMNGNGAAQ